MNRLSTALLSLSAAALATLAFAAPPAPATSNPAPAPAPTAAGTIPSDAGVSKTADTVREIELPLETGTYRQGEGAHLAQAFCITCHSVEYCETQPLSGEKYWAATVKKMKEKFGAPLPEEAIAPLTKYLTEAYGKPTP